MAKKMTFNIGDQIYFIDRGYDKFCDHAIRMATVTKVNTKTVKAEAAAKSGWNIDEDFTIKLEDIVAVATITKHKEVRLTKV